MIILQGELSRMSEWVNTRGDGSIREVLAQLSILPVGFVPTSAESSGVRATWYPAIGLCARGGEIARYWLSI